MTLALATAVLTSGCRPAGQGRTLASTRGEEIGPSEKGAVSARDRMAADEAAAVMDSVRSLLQDKPLTPESYKSVVDQLTQYLSRSESSLTPLTEERKSLIAGVLGTERVSEAERTTFNQQDIDYLDNALLLHRAARSIAERAPDPLAIARESMEYIARNVQLIEPGVAPRARPKDVCFRGRGSAVEISWLFLELLRQNGVQGVVLAVPAPDRKDAFVSFLCGALIGGEVHLFDPEAMIPLPNGSGGVATAKELSRKPELFAWLDGLVPGVKRPLKTADIRQLTLLVHVEPVMVSPRMQFLEQWLTGDSKPKLHVDLKTMLTPIGAAASELKDGGGVRLWLEPQNIIGELAFDEQSRRRIRESINPIWFSRRTNPRLQQLHGQHEVALRELVQVDGEVTVESLLLSGGDLPEPQKAIIRRSVGLLRQDLSYFMAVSQFGMKPSRAAAAAEGCRRYLDRFGSVRIDRDDVLDFGVLANRLLADSKKAEPSPGGRVWTLLSPEARKAVEQLAASYEQIIKGQAMLELEQKKIEMALREADREGGRTLSDEDRKILQKANTEIRMNREILARQSLVGSEGRNLMLKELNDLLDRPDLRDGASFAALEKGSQAIQDALKAGTPDKLKGEARRTFNRMLIANAFAEAIDGLRDHWVPNAVRLRMTSLKQTAGLAEAEKALTAAEPFLEPAPLARLRAVVKLWKQEPAAKPAG
jgi:hypothetical protein